MFLIATTLNGVAANWWDAYIRAVPTEEEIRAEMLRLRDRGAVPD